MNATITTPTAGSMGGAVRITYNGKSYLIGNKTREDISNYLYSAPAGGTYPIVIKGTFSRETGYFPNPTATFDIITVTAIQ